MTQYAVKTEEDVQKNGQSFQYNTGV